MAFLVDKSRLVPNAALTGTSPHTLEFLAQLMRLDLSLNAISGEIPEEMGLLKNLILFDLVGNR